MATRRSAKAPEHGALLRTGLWFSGLPDDFQTALLDAAVLRRVKRGEAIFRRGEPPDGFYAVLSGRVGFTRAAMSGKPLLLRFFEASSWFGELSTFDGLIRDCDAIADSAATLLKVPQVVFIAILDDKPERWRLLGELLASRLRLMVRQIEDLETAPVRERVANRLVVIADGYGDLVATTRPVIHARQEHLATMIGVSRQTLSLALRDFAAAGVVRMTYAKVEICDLPALRTIARL